MAASAPEIDPKTRARRTFEIFKTTQSVLKQGKVAEADNPYAKDLAEQVGRMEAEHLEVLIRTGKANVSMKSESYLWRDLELARELTRLARPLYIDAQNQKVAELLGDRQLTIAALGEIAASPITTEGLEPVQGPVTGTLEEVRTEEGLILLKPDSGQTDDPSALNIHLLSHDGSLLIDLSVSAQEAPSAAEG